MTREELKEQLSEKGFKREEFSEYHNEAFKNESYEYKGSAIFIEVFVDYYNVRMVWWHEKGKKVTKNYYVNRELKDFRDAEELISAFIEEMIGTYGVKTH